MKQFFTAFAAAALTVTAAQAYDMSYTVDPAEGEVSVLQLVTVTFPNVDEIEIYSRDALTITRDGQTVKGVDVEVVNDNQLQFMLGAEQTQPATYHVNIPEWSVAGYAAYDAANDEYGYYGIVESDIVITYEIKSSMPVGVFDWSYMVLPEEGVVTEIRDINIMFDGVEELDINSKSDIVLARDGVPVAADKTVEANFINIEPADVLREPGTYTLTFPANVLTGYGNDEGDGYEDIELNPEDIVMTWVIEGAADATDWSYMVMPEEGVVDELRDIQVYFPNIEALEVAGDIVLACDGVAVEGVEVVEVDSNLLGFELPDVLNAPGVYTLTFPEGALLAKNDGVCAVNEEIELSWTIESAQAPVEYTLSLAISTPKPNADGEISAEKSLESIFFYCEEPNLVVAPGTAANVTIREVNGDFQASGRLKKAYGVNENYSYFSASFGKEPTYNGRYEITVEQGAFGNEAWSLNPETGVSNPELIINFNLVDGADRDIYTIKPVEVTPATGSFASPDEIAKVTVKFAEGVTPVAGAIATLVGTGTVTYQQDAAFEADGDAYTAVFSPAPTENGVYMLSVSAGAFTDGTSFNAPIDETYTVSFDSGVATIMQEGAVKVYNLQGQPVSTDLRTLPAGVYIIDGKKVMVK
ncbi:MAG: hypothetical protein K2O78_09885 [Muribaculaceae bacterium]|nr:hypothetical protein [Muribaculaceae bacterium]MDE7081948.1 hypothetical protein [Muribaculaceae bacterium]